ncbi:nucleoside hydrolase [uncultured Sneathia sp.]|uniref:nucleoside hydrolase n=1 Tax=uncultured Sneathia sp. TaxID=278067 RepID=UPI0028045122|nr:nucleoside hydrolase [uncultured Sneathia sp.]
MIPVIIDTDPGIDDAIAIALAIKCSKLDIRLITTVAGNVGIENTTRNALNLVSFFGRPDIQVARGSSKPLIQKFVDGSEFHGKSGLGSIVLKKSLNKAKDNAVEEMKNVILNSNEKISIIALGPLTNIALLLKSYPSVKDNIEKIVLMGGSIGRGNMSPLVEFNIGADPDAAKIVFNEGIDITMIGLEMGDDARISEDDLKDSKTEIGKFCYQAIVDYRGGKIGKIASIYDATAVAYLVNPNLFKTRKLFVDIEIQGQYTRGATVVDLNGVYKKEPNTTVALEINSNEFRNWLIKKLSQ